MITWLILALPLQGAVAATVRHCALPSAAAQADAKPVQQVHHHHPHHHPHHLHDGPQQARAGTDQAAAHGAMSAADSAGKCSVCAACCPAMAAVLPSLQWPLPLPGAMRYGAWAPAAPPEGLPAGLERPPRLARV